MLHTLGPWRACGTTVQAVDGSVVCQTQKPEDAKLIAQAPELLRLLKERTYDYNKHYELWADQNRDRRLAIGRAEGTLG